MSADFFTIQTGTSWGKTLQAFADWSRPQPGWQVLDVGCGPGLFPALLAQKGCRSFGLERDTEMLWPAPLHADTVQGDAFWLPFDAASFDMLTASNLLFLLAEPLEALNEMGRVLRPGGQLTMLNPSKELDLESARSLAERHGLQGAARESLLNWAARAEANHRWSAAETHDLYAAAGLQMTESVLKVGPGFARFSRAIKPLYKGSKKETDE